MSSAHSITVKAVISNVPSFGFLVFSFLKKYITSIFKIFQISIPFVDLIKVFRGISYFPSFKWINQVIFQIAETCKPLPVS